MRRCHIRSACNKPQARNMLGPVEIAEVVAFRVGFQFAENGRKMSVEYE